MRNQRRARYLKYSFATFSIFYFMFNVHCSCTQHITMPLSYLISAPRCYPQDNLLPRYSAGYDCHYKEVVLPPIPCHQKAGGKNIDQLPSDPIPPRQLLCFELPRVSSLNIHSLQGSLQNAAAVDQVLTQQRTRKSLKTALDAGL